MRPFALALLALAATSSEAALIGDSAEQLLLEPTDQEARALPIPQKSLHGRFIHLTDLHPDPFYRFNSSEDGACHGGTGRDEDRGERAGWWGTSVSDCDAPLTLINATFDWLEANFKGKVDFVVWTGDNARHDIDSRFPRSLPEIFRLNRYVAERMRRTFGKVPVVTSIGNNDIFPHNTLFGPKSPMTARINNELLKIWKHYIPEVHLHSFARGGYYTVEAIPSQLLLVSLNTIYFYENNKAVDGCPSFAHSNKYSSMKKDDDPGTEQLLWLEQQLLLARARGMQVWMTGHVPATKSNWYDGCYSRYGELVLSFHDTIVGQLFGHMNVDHFSFIQAADVLSGQQALPLDSPISTSGSSAVLIDNLLSQYQSLPSEKATKERDFAAVHINPSVIPTYLPAFRVWEYNTTIEGKWRQPPSFTEAQKGDETDEWRARLSDEEEDVLEPRPPVFHALIHRILAVLPSSLTPRQLDAFSPVPASLVEPVTPLRHRKKRPSYPPLPRYSSPQSPSRTNAFLSPLSFTQYFLRLDEFNAHEGYGTKERLQAGGERPRPEWVIEYTTKKAEEVAKELKEKSQSDDRARSEEMKLWPEGVRRAVESGWSEKEIARRLREEDVTPYELADLTLGRWLKLARKVAKGGRDWKDYRKRMFVSSKDDS